MKKRLYRILTVILIFTMVIMPVKAKEEDQPALKLYAKSAVLMDADSGRVLYNRNGQEQLPMASTTKIMTLILALEKGNPEDIVEVSSYAASMPEVKLKIRKGEHYRLKDLFYSLMLESHNDSAVAIAEHVGGSVEEFAGMMNQKAEEIGCRNTCFITPNGLDATADFIQEDGSRITRAHSTTATDMASILSYCITKSPQKEAFLEITRTPSYAFTNKEGTRSFSCNNHNAFLTMMSGALTGKTGFTCKAGYCYVGALKQDNRTYVVALLACGWPNHKTYKWSDTRTLMEYGLSNYEHHDLMQEVIPQEATEPVLVRNGQTDKICERAYSKVTCTESEDSAGSILMRQDESVRTEIVRNEELTAPVTEGMHIGEVNFYVGDEKWRSVELTATEEIAAVNMEWCIKQVLRKWLISNDLRSFCAEK